MTAVDALLNTARILGQHPAHSPEWHQLRAGGIGGSEVAAILGLSPWQSPYSLWHSKRNGWTSEPNDEMRWGSAIEPALLAWWFEQHPQFTPFGEDGATYSHRARAWQHANPDALGVNAVGDLVLVEAKKASDDDAWGTPGTDEIPPYYRVQAVHYMDVLGITATSFVVSSFGRAPDFYWVTYDPEEARLIRGHAAQFWRSLQHGVAPDLDGHSATYQAVRRLHPLIERTTVTLDAALAEGYLGSKAQVDDAERIAFKYKSRVLDAMGSARLAEDPTGQLVARRQPGRNGHVSLYAIGSL